MEGAARVNILQVGTGSIKIPPQKYGGIESHIFYTSKHMVRLGHSVTVIDIKETKSDPDIEYIDSVRYVRLHTRKSGFTSDNFIISYISHRINAALFALRVSAYLKKNSFDIIHLHATTVIGLILTSLNRKMRQKTVYSAYSPFWFMSSLGKLDRLALFADHYVMQRADQLIVQNDSLKERLGDMGKINHEKITLISPGADTSLFRPDIDTTDIRERYGLEGHVTILFNGRIVPYKGVEYLVRAADTVVNKFGYKKALFLLVGPLAEDELDKIEHGDYIAGIFGFIKETGLEVNVKLTGAVPLEELFKLFSACDIFVLPSVAETFGMVVSQAMASAKPAIGTRIGSIPAQIKDDWNGYLVEPANEQQLAEKIKYLIDNPDERQRMGLNGRKLAKDQFDWSRVTEQTLQVYQRVVESGQGKK